MKTRYFIQLVLAIVATATLAAEKPIFECLVAETRISVFMSEADFDSGDHVIERKPGPYGPETLYIDGEIPIGSDNQIPEKAWRRFEVFWDDEKVSIPSSLYESHYHPNIDENAIKNRLLVFTIDPRGQ